MSSSLNPKCFFAWWWSAAALLAFVGCGGDAQSACTVDEDLIALRTECIESDDCPCGTYCSAGLCAYDCRSSTDCTTGVCDRFGRCVGSVTPIGAITQSAEAVLRVSDEPIALDTTHPIGTFAVAVTGDPVGVVRIRGDRVRVRCPGDQFAEECALNATSLSTPVTIDVEAEDPASDVGGTVQVITGQGTEVVVVTTGAPTVAPEPAFEGVWEGHAYLVGAGSRSRPGTTINSQALAELPMPVTVKVYPEVAGVRPVELTALDTMVFPEVRTIGELRRDGSLLQLRHARRPYVTGEGEDGARVLVSGESHAFERTGTTMTFLLQSTYWGVTTDPWSPMLEWRIVLRRTADLPTGATAPTIATDEPTVAANVRAATTLQLEAAAPSDLQVNIDSVGMPPAELTESTRGAARALCTPEGASVPSSFTSAGVLGWSGDLLCREERDGAMGGQHTLAFGPFGETTFDIATTISGCVADLGRFVQASQGETPTGEPSGCVDGPRFALALTHANAIDRGLVLGTETVRDEQASALGHRLVQQWAQTLSFIATQSVQIDRLNDVLGGGGSSTMIDRDFDQFDMLERTAIGWDLLLHPRVGIALAALPADVIATPDYRVRVFPTTTFAPQRFQDLRVGVPVALASALARSLDAHAALLDRSRFVTADLPRAITFSQAFARRSVVLFALASALEVTASTTSADPLSWHARWETAASGYGGSLALLVRALDIARGGGNPLGIDDDLDLPLYRVGDEMNTLERFSAVTDYLVGTNDTSPVGSAVAAAEARRTEARTAFVGALSRNYLEATNDSQTRTRLAAVQLDSGGTIYSLCGDSTLDTNAIVAGTLDVDENTCWIREDCRRTAAAAIESASPREVALTVCTLRRLGERAAPALGSARSAAASLQTPSVDAFMNGTVTASGMQSARDNVLVTFSDGSRVTLPAALLDGSTDVASPGGEIPLAVLDEIDAECRVIATASEAARPAEVPSGCELIADCPSGYFCRAGACTVDVGTDDAPSCYRGNIGELAVALRGAITDLDVARAEADELTESYRVRMGHCTLLETTEARRTAATSQFNDVMTNLGAGKLAAQVVANVAGAVGECASSADSPFKLFTAQVGCGAAFVKAAAQSVVDGLDFRMEQVQREHDALMSMLDGSIAVSECTTEANLEMVGLRSAQLRIRRAMEEIAAQQVAIENAKTDIRVEVATGRAEYARQVADQVPPIEFDFWLNSTVVEYDAAFRRARRALYLGVLALEFEYQLSSSERTAVLSATSVTELRDSLVRLRNLAASGTVGGAAPSALLSVVSLRGELLGVADRSNGPEGNQNLSEVERFRLLLASPRFARYSDSGVYEGQEIPFRVAPLGADRNPGRLAIFAGEDCAERIWSMNASILGTNPLVGSDSTRTRITLRKRNTFFSQWCSPTAESTAFQVAATRPSINLFLDPATDFTPEVLDPRSGTFDALHQADAFASARLQPVLNVTRAELENDTYFNGSSRELAGRGLYGDYTIFLPAESLSHNGSVGLDLSHVDDILVRFDYVSVAR